MNSLLLELSKFCSDHLLDEKVLVAPTLAVGHQITESLSRSGHPWVNLRVETVGTLAANLIGPDLTKSGKRILSKAQSLALVEQACLQVLGQESYFGKLGDRAGFHRAVQRTLADIRASNISTQDISPELLETEQKADELRAVTNTYNQLLSDGGFVDSTDIFRIALIKAQSVTVSDGAWYLVPEGLDASGVEGDFLNALAGANRIELKTDLPDEWYAELDDVQITRSLGEEGEVREVLHQVLREKLPFDSVEVIYTDSGTYIPLFYEIAAQYGVPCTFAHGIPIAFTRPGQAAAAFLEWLSSGYDANVLRRKIAEGCIDFSSVTPGGDKLGALAAARIIRESGIGWGRGRHLSCIDSLIEKYEKRSQRPQDDGEYEVASEAMRVKCGEAKAVREFVAQILALTEAAASKIVDYTQLAGALSKFIERFASVANELDGTARRVLINVLAEFAELPSAEVSLEPAVSRIQEAVTGISVDQSGPVPGHIHVSDYKSGGYSGRRRVFVVGLDESRHPGKEIQDPVLLDSERDKINAAKGSSQLPLMAARPMENAAAMRACLARLRGKVTLSFSCRSLMDDREQFPSAIVLEAFRLKNSAPEADYTSMLARLDAPSGFLCRDGVCLDATEWWLSAVRSNNGADCVKKAVESVYSWLEDGRVAESERDSSLFTVYDGKIDLKIPELDPCANGTRLSATRIESLAKCPFAYFAKNVLGIAPVEDVAYDPSRWLDPMDYGTLIHEILREFMETITSRNETLSAAKHSDELIKIADSMIERQRAEVPPPNEAAFKAQRDEILRTCRVFLKAEEEHCKNATPVFFEVPFGYGEAAGASGIASKDPVRIDLGNGGTFLFTGKIDRIDRTPGSNWEIWDYKSGSTWAYREESVFNGGRQLQHALYAAAAQQLLQRAGYGGEVVRSGYFFPSMRAGGSRIVKEPDYPRMQALLCDLFELIKSGAFISTGDKDDCRYCDYKVCCGGEAAPKRSKLKVEWPENVLLNPVRRLADHG